MKKSVKNAISVLSCAALLLGLLIASGVSGNRSPLFPVEAAGETELPTGRCGDDAIWYFDANTSTLTVSGTGAIVSEKEYRDDSWGTMEPYFDTIKLVVINSGITAIGEDIFSCCESMTDVVIPDSVTRIDRSAFFGCTGLTSVTIPDSVESIGKEAFCYCTNLTDVTLSESVSTLGDDAFCSTAYANDDANWQNDGLYLGDFLLAAKPTASGDFEIQAGTKHIANSAFRGCESLTGVIIPDGVKNIPAKAFYDCAGLRNVTIPESVQSIGCEAFYGCENLTGVTIPTGVTSIEDNAFVYCRNLEQVNLADSVVNIGSGAFYGCENLMNVVLPAGVENIGGGAFEN